MQAFSGKPPREKPQNAAADNEVRKNSLNIKFLGGIFLGHPGPRRRDIPDKNFMQVAFFCCFRQGGAGMSRDLGRDVLDLENFMQENFGLIFRTLDNSLHSGPLLLLPRNLTPSLKSKIKLKQQISKEGYWGRSKRGRGKRRNGCAIGTQ